MLAMLNDAEMVSGYYNRKTASQVSTLAHYTALWAVPSKFQASATLKISLNNK
jgi:hypothetical protein